MDCRFVERSISEYVGGDLPAPQALELEQHLQDCPNCKALHADFLQMIAACQALPNLEARDEVWRLLKDRLPAALPDSPESSEHQRETSRHWGKVFSDSVPGEAQPEDPAHETIFRLRRSLVFYRRFAYAALSLAVLSLLAWGGQFVYQRNLNAALVSAPMPIEAVEIQRAEVHYQYAIKLLTQALERNRKEWDPGTRSVVEQNLKTIDASIAECEAALLRDPNSLEAGTYLLAAYRKKVEFLKSVLEPSAI